MVNVEVPGGSIVMEGDLQPVRMSDLLRLEHGVELLNEDDSFRAFGLLDHKETQGRSSEFTSLCLKAEDLVSL